MKEVTRAIYRTLAYQSVFDCCLRLSDLSKFLISNKYFSEHELLEALLAVRNVFVEGEYSSLKKISNIREANDRIKYSELKIKKARRMAKFLKLFPWFRMIAISGAVASYNAVKDDDIDVFVVVSPHRLWIARLTDWLVLNMLGVRRNASSKNVNDRICINYYVTEDNLELPNKDVFTANEIARVIPLHGFSVYKKFILANSWIADYMSNFWNQFTTKYERYKVPRDPFRLILLDPFEILLRNVQIQHMESRITKEIVSECEIKFHPKDVRITVLEKYGKALQKIGVRK